MIKFKDWTIRPIVVTLQELPERTAFIQNHFKEIGLNAENFNGISADVSGLVTSHTYELDNPGSEYRIGAKPTATWVSFYMLWSAMQYMDATHFLQLEWDAKFEPGWWKRTEQALKDVPKDFDMLYLGSCCTEGRPRTHVAGEVYDLKYPVCGHAVVIAKKALPILLSTNRKIFAPLDISIMLNSFPHLRVFTVLPRIASQFDTHLPV